jgi:hypothetical protein
MDKPAHRMIADGGIAAAVVVLSDGALMILDSIVHEMVAIIFRDET